MAGARMPRATKCGTFPRAWKTMRERAERPENIGRGPLRGRSTKRRSSIGRTQRQSPRGSECASFGS
jgi:hypothetical protein